jgi:hypothetical protein
MTMRFSLVVLSISAAAFYACGSSGSGTNGGGAGAGGSHGGVAGGHGTAGNGSAGSGAAATGAGGAVGTAGSGGRGGGGRLGSGGAGGAITTCTPGVQGNAIVDCGYPYASNNPLTNIAFSESEVLRAIEPSGGAPMATVRVFYNDEHALTLGVRQVVVTGGTSSMTDYPVSPLATDPGSVVDAKTGSNVLAGPQSGLDVSLRPMWPVLFITDITADPNSRAGDWQQGGAPRSPNAIFGSWKAAVRTVDTSVTPNLIKITPDADPMKNAWNLGTGDPVPAGLTNQGYGAEVRWDLALTPGHSYRIQAMVHDGDQNKTGGDSGEACVIFCAGGDSGAGGAGGGYVPPPTMCPNAMKACGGGGIDPATCPSGTVCANGCCLPIIP